jgi:hypothetical protein
LEVRSWKLKVSAASRLGIGSWGLGIGEIDSIDLIDLIARPVK